MPRVHHVKKARKDNPVCVAGESYYWWKFPYRGKSYSLTYPKPSQLTQSDFLSQYYDLIDEIGSLTAEGEELRAEVPEIISRIRQLGEEQSDKQMNMPDSLQYSPTGELLENRYSNCEEWADALEGVDLEDPDGGREAENHEELEGLTIYWENVTEDLISCDPGME